jgi:predicted TIM-barrel fold metal-dependent hydrolase
VDLKLFDAHFHIIDGRFPLVSNNGFIPEQFTCANYLERMRDYNLLGGAVVSGSFQAFDQSYLIATLKQLGPSFAGVTQLPEAVSDRELLRLNSLGVRALRFNFMRGSSESIRNLDRMARRVDEVVGWHVELYADSRELKELYRVLISLPSVSIDHLGLSSEGFSTIIKLAERGVRVKATGFGRGDLDIKSALRDLYSANPGSLMFGTDLPSTRATRPYTDEDFALVLDTLGTVGAKRVFYDNAAGFYGLQTSG